MNVSMAALQYLREVFGCPDLQALAHNQILLEYNEEKVAEGFEFDVELWEAVQRNC